MCPKPLSKQLRFFRTRREHATLRACTKGNQRLEGALVETRMRPRTPYWPWALLDTLWLGFASWDLKRESRFTAVASALAYWMLPQQRMLARAWIWSLTFEAGIQLALVLLLPKGYAYPQPVEVAHELRFGVDACNLLQPWRFALASLLALLVWTRSMALWTTRSACQG